MYSIRGVCGVLLCSDHLLLSLNLRTGGVPCQAERDLSQALRLVGFRTALSPANNTDQPLDVSIPVGSFDVQAKGDSSSKSSHKEKKEKKSKKSKRGDENDEVARPNNLLFF